MNNLQKITYHVNDNIDLHDVFSVVVVPEGKKRKLTRRNMLVREFIEFLRNYPQDAELSYNCSYYGDNAEIVISWDRIETDEEYEARIKELKKRSELDKLRKEEQKKKTEKQEKETLLKLAAKYKIKIDKEI